MDNITHLGLDVHKDTIAVAILRPGDLALDQRVIANTPEAVRKLVARCGDPPSLLACLRGEAHRLPYSPDSHLALAYDVTSSPRRSPPGEWVCGSRPIALTPAISPDSHRAGELTAIRIPTPAEEPLRELMRTREDLKADCRIAQQRIRSFLMRQGRRYPQGRSGWTERFDRWLRSQRSC